MVHCMTSSRSSDGERGEETAPLVHVSESGQSGTSSGTCVPEDNQPFDSTLQLPSPNGHGVTSHTLEIDPSALQDNYFESALLVEECSRPECLCTDYSAANRETTDDAAIVFEVCRCSDTSSYLC